MQYVSDVVSYTSKIVTSLAKHGASRRGNTAGSRAPAQHEQAPLFVKLEVPRCDAFAASRVLSAADVRAEGGVDAMDEDGSGAGGPTHAEQSSDQTTRERRSRRGHKREASLGTRARWPMPFSSKKDARRVLTCVDVHQGMLLMGYSSGDVELMALERLVAKDDEVLVGTTLVARDDSGHKSVDAALMLGNAYPTVVLRGGKLICLDYWTLKPVKDMFSGFNWGRVLQLVVDLRAKVIGRPVSWQDVDMIQGEWVTTPDTQSDCSPNMLAVTKKEVLLFRFLVVDGRMVLVRSSCHVAGQGTT